MLQNIPGELRALPQWCAALDDGKPVNPRTGNLAKVDDPSTWGTFEQAVATGLPHVGFVFSVNDPYSVIDLDDKPHDPATDADKTAFRNIIKHFTTYTEKSRSRRGYHLVCKGNIGTGRRRGHVEVYSSGRFVILTGIEGAGEIEERQDVLDLLVSEMPISAPAGCLEDTEEEVLSDAELVERATYAKNGDKFVALCKGDMTGYGSQSEADMALLSILAFYTRNNEQVRRIFRMTALGKRDKATRNNKIIDYALSKIRGREPPPIDAEQIVKTAEELVAKTPKPPKDIPQKVEKEHEAILRPPGFLGELADYLYQIAVRPVPEISVAAAIGLAAGIAGRAYNISGSGLNQYILLLAPTGRGKEGIQNGIDHIIDTLKQTLPSVDDFIGPAHFASGQALIRTLDNRPAFVSVIGEFGLFLQQLSDAKGAAPYVMLRKVMLDVYGKSGWRSSLRSSAYSDSEKNTKTVKAPAPTFLGESTPSTFFDWIGPNSIADGLIPRFLVMHYTGPRPAKNPNPFQPVPQSIYDRLALLATAAITSQRAFQCTNVAETPEANAILEAFDKEADSFINNHPQDTPAELWNRAHLKTLKLAALLAVCDNPHQPTITEEHARWAIYLVRKDITTMLDRFFTGDLGQGDSKQLNDLRRLVTGYFQTEEAKLVQSYALPAGLRTAGVIPYVYLSRRTMTLASFRQDSRGSTFALKRAIEEMVAAGEMQELPQTSPLRGQYSGRAFVVRK